MMLAKGVEASGWLDRVGRATIARVASERALALVLIAGSALAAMLLTNDIVLFAVVPLTLGLGRIARLPLCRLVIFEALAVNAGAMLTPIGNPQNIFLWQRSGVGFAAFAVHMWPPFVIVNLCLLALTAAAFSGRRIRMENTQHASVLDKPMLTASALLFAPFIVLADLHYPAAALALVAGVFLLAFPGLLRRIDWALIVVFALMFVNLGMLARYRPLAGFDLSSPANLFVAGAVTSQIVSNVPTAILLSRHSDDWMTLAWAVNVGAFGLATGSLANLIALRLGRQRGGLLAFHAWSLPFFIVVGGLVWLWLRL